MSNGKSYDPMLADSIPMNIMLNAQSVWEWFAKNNFTDWTLGELCSRTYEDKLSAANARVAELWARLNEVGPAYTGALMRINELEAQLLANTEKAKWAFDEAMKMHRDKLTQLRTAAQKALPYICTDKECMGEDESTNASEAYDELVRSLGQ